MKMPKELSHQKLFFELAENLGLKTAKKNNDYGNAFENVAEIFKILYPNGIPVHQYKNATLLVRVLDKICRLANEREKFFNEDAWDDICGYALVGKVSNFKEKVKKGVDKK